VTNKEFIPVVKQKAPIQAHQHKCGIAGWPGMDSATRKNATHRVQNSINAEIPFEGSILPSRRNLSMSNETTQGYEPQCAATAARDRCRSYPSSESEKKRKEERKRRRQEEEEEGETAKPKGSERRKAGSGDTAYCSERSEK